MAEPEAPLRNISDTACWAAVYRANETERRDALFHDPFARRLAGERGQQIADSLPDSQKTAWAWVMRTYLFDQFISAEVAKGVDLVVNLAAGLDARPYRMKLPASLRWIEVDLPEPLDLKERVLANAAPVCTLERIRLDLSQLDARRRLFEQLGNQAKKALIITEGLLTYLTPEEVGALAEDLARPTSFQRWILELGSPGLLKMIQKQWNKQLGQAGAPLKFAPEEGPLFFTRFGWKPLDVRSVLKTAAKLKRISFFMRLLALMPESKGKQGSRPWSGICLFGRVA